MWCFLLAASLLGDVTVSKQAVIRTDSAIEEVLLDTGVGLTRGLQGSPMSDKPDLSRFLRSVTSLKISLDGDTAAKPTVRRVLLALGKTLAFVVGFDAGSVGYSYSARFGAFPFERWCHIHKGRVDTGALITAGIDPRLEWVRLSVSAREPTRRDLIGVLTRWLLDTKVTTKTTIVITLTGRVKAPEPCIGHRLIKRIALRKAGPEHDKALQKGLRAAKLAAQQGRDILEAALPPIWTELRSY